MPRSARHASSWNRARARGDDHAVQATARLIAAAGEAPSTRGHGRRGTVSARKSASAYHSHATPPHDVSYAAGGSFAGAGALAAVSVANDRSAPDVGDWPGMLRR